MDLIQKRRIVLASVTVAGFALAVTGAGLGYAAINKVPAAAEAPAEAAPAVASSTTGTTAPAKPPAAGKDKAEDTAKATVKATRTVNVSSAAQLKSALAAAKAGDVITLAAGTYDGAFFSTASGTAAEPITLTGPRGAVLSNTKNGCDPNTPSGRSVTYCGFGFHLNGADFWKLTGFSVKSANKGIVLDESNRVVIDGVAVSDVRDEGVHFRTSSSDNVLQNSTVTDTGTGQPGFGEGVYLGSAKSNWAKFGGAGGVDHSDRNKVVNNKIGPGVAAELIDIKEGTVDGLISGNTFNGTGVSGANSADSWIDAKGNDYTIKDNVGTGPSGDLDGYQTHQQVANFGCGNVFTGNSSKLSSSGFAINITNQSKCGGNLNVVGAGNTVTGAKSGLSNISVTG